MHSLNKLYVFFFKVQYLFYLKYYLKQISLKHAEAAHDFSPKTSPTPQKVSSSDLIYFRCSEI